MLREVRGRRGGLGPWEWKVTKARGQERMREELSARDGHGAREGEGDGEGPAASRRCGQAGGSPFLGSEGNGGAGGSGAGSERVRRAEDAQAVLGRAES